MLPWGHAAVAYLLYTAYRRSRGGPGPTGPAALAVLLGSQFPDVVDKPLAWTFGLLASGRSLGHSWLLAVPVLLVAWRLLDGERRALLVPVGVGWLSHGLADGVLSVAAWEPAYLGYVLWPLTTTPPYDTEPSFAAHLLAVELTPYVLLQWLLFGVTVVVWHRDGRPGTDSIRSVYDGVTGRFPG